MQLMNVTNGSGADGLAPWNFTGEFRAVCVCLCARACVCEPMSVYGKARGLALKRLECAPVSI